MRFVVEASWLRTERYGPFFPGRVSVQVSTVQEGFTEVLSVPSREAPDPGVKFSEEDVIVRALAEFCRDLEELTLRADAIIEVAERQ